MMAQDASAASCKTVMPGMFLRRRLNIPSPAFRTCRHCIVGHAFVRSCNAFFDIMRVRLRERWPGSTQSIASACLFHAVPFKDSSCACCMRALHRVTRESSERATIRSSFATQPVNLVSDDDRNVCHCCCSAGGGHSRSGAGAPLPIVSRIEGLNTSVSERHDRAMNGVISRDPETIATLVDRPTKHRISAEADPEVP